MKTHVTRTRPRGLVWLSLVLATVAFAATGCVPSASSAPPPVIIYGDSNVALTEEELQPGATIRWIGNSAPCDHFATMQKDAALKPRVVIFAFTGATYSPCARNDSRHDVYVRDYKKARAFFPATTRVYVVLPSPTKFPAAMLLAANSNQDVWQAAMEVGLPRLDAWSALGGRKAPYVVQDGIHLGDDGQVIYGRVLSAAW